MQYHQTKKHKSVVTFAPQGRATFEMVHLTAELSEAEKNRAMHVLGSRTVIDALASRYLAVEAHMALVAQDDIDAGIKQIEDYVNSQHIGDEDEVDAALKAAGYKNIAELGVIARDAALTTAENHPGVLTNG